ncbi:hypothetical protein HPP92_027567 [Vanilla planifolia]|uniref:Uncharacterized protein n=1 Tax=Vanilla planifolia TaxID=51239 RepID=A0A835U470_VANPL|nr:hypothetical protein HPP92_027567 [Vanilla planifolia]
MTFGGFVNIYLKDYDPLEIQRKISRETVIQTLYEKINNKNQSSVEAEKEQTKVEIEMDMTLKDIQVRSELVIQNRIVEIDKRFKQEKTITEQVNA